MKRRKRWIQFTSHQLGQCIILQISRVHRCYNRHMAPIAPDSMATILHIYLIWATYVMTINYWNHTGYSLTSQMGVMAMSCLYLSEHNVNEYWWASIQSIGAAGLIGKRTPHTEWLITILVFCARLYVSLLTSNSRLISFCCYSISGHPIATNLCTCHDSTAVVACAQFCSDRFVRIPTKKKMKCSWNLNFGCKIISVMVPSITQPSIWVTVKGGGSDFHRFYSSLRR